MSPNRSAGRLAVAAAVCLSFGARPAAAEDPSAELDALREQLRKLERRIEDLEAREAKEEKDEAPERASGEAALDAALAEVEPEPTAPDAARPPILSGRFGPAQVRLIDLSLDALVAVGGSTEDDEELRLLQAGGHDPRNNGFTVQNVELSGTGAVDPYLYGEGHFIFFLDPETSETVVELEEAFFQTLALPYGLQLEGGHFFTEFGRVNPQHPHQWHWQDQPIIHSRVFGPDGMRNPGVRLARLLPLPWFSELHVGVQDATGETMASFLGGELGHAHGEEDGGEEAGVAGEGAREEEVEGDEHAFEEGIGGRPIVDRTVRNPGDLVWLARWANSFDLTEEVSTQLGLSFLTGPNTTGEDARTRVYGADLVLKYRPARNFRGWPFFIFESEFIAREFEADELREPDDPAVILFPGETLRDYGFYTQGLLGLTYGWATGLRFESVTGDGESLEGGRAADSFRDDRIRVSPLLVWQPTEFSRFRLQYNVDDADHLDGRAHSVWLGAEFLYGAHPAHSY